MIDIEIDDEVYEYLQQHANVFVETTPNQVLRRLLGISPGADTTIGASKNFGTVKHIAGNALNSDRLTSQERYQEVIMTALKELGGKARTKDVLLRVGEILENEHTNADLATYPSGGVRWQARASSEALVLRREGFLKKDGKHGWWELTEEGNTYASSQ